ncbi:pyrolysin [Thermococcus sp. GR6]|uniref:pyrolysin n=1 Tax=Thermococcus sp. GR6 TaxID=1638256 RepID=UPI001431D49D|nr:pyrolysin [Thermococcus sp. GR6]NJE42224.1 pyrolysin [Thermococcus sp. GR6]
MKRAVALLAVLMVVLVPFAGAAGAITWSYENFIKQSIAWYYLYQSDEEKFNELYNLSVQTNVSNETLQLAMELYTNATAEFEKALMYGIPDDGRTLRWVVFSVHIRKAYLYIEQAIELLEAVIENESA